MCFLQICVSAIIEQFFLACHELFNFEPKEEKGEVRDILLMIAYVIRQLHIHRLPRMTLREVDYVKLGILTFEVMLY